MERNDLSVIIRNRDARDDHDDPIFLPVYESSSRVYDNACGCDVARG